MCHAFLTDSRFYRFLFELDQDIARQVQADGCSCGGVLHSARYPRKPRGLRSPLDESYDYEIYGTRLVCNPRGYAPDALNPDFRPDLVVEV